MCVCMYKLCVHSGVVQCREGGTLIFKDTELNFQLNFHALNVRAGTFGGLTKTECIHAGNSIIRLNINTIVT